MSIDTNIEKHRNEFLTIGFTLIEKQIENPDMWKDKIISSPDLKDVYVPEEMRKVAAGKGSLKYSVIDRFQVDAVLPELNSYYKNLVPLLRDITYSDIITSPFERSAYYAKVYSQRGDEQGWHFDTNGLTVIIYLTNNSKSGRTEIERLGDNEKILVSPKAGSILVLQGRKCWHRAEPVSNEVKVICPLNYYVEKAEDRDHRLDDIIFGNI